MKSLFIPKRQTSLGNTNERGPNETVIETTPRNPVALPLPIDDGQATTKRAGLTVWLRPLVVARPSTIGRGAFDPHANGT